MKYKNSDYQDQLNASSPMLRQVLSYFENRSQLFGIEPVVTRVWDPVSRDSGVHQAKRAVDLRDETIVNDGTYDIHHFLYTPKQTEFIVNEMNHRYPRNDGKLVCIHHSFEGGLMHFHLQIPYVWK